MEVNWVVPTSPYAGGGLEGSLYRAGNEEKSRRVSPLVKLGCV